MKQYKVTGMSCAACQSRVEKAVKTVPGVESCSVSLLTNSMGVEGTASDEDIIKAVTDVGYGASKVEQNSGNVSEKYDEMLNDAEIPKIRKRLIISVLLLLPLMYVSMGHMMFNFPLPGFMRNNHVAMGLYELVLTTAIMIINQKFFINGFKGLVHRAPNMDTLVALGSFSAYGYSIFALCKMISYQSIGDHLMTAKYMDELYFESSATILTLITVGKMLEAMAKGRTTNALKSLIKLAPKTAVLLIDNKEVETSIDNVAVGDRFCVKPGESIPVDGVVVSGDSAVNEASLTGESIPVNKKAGDEVYASTINTSGYIVCEATKVGEDTSLSQIIKMVSDAAATKAPIAKIADKVSGVFVPVVIGIAIITFIVWMIARGEFGFALARAISVLVISCPCALGLATPVAIMVGNGVSAKTGIMFKTAVSLEQTGKAQIVVLDKTGTITKGEPSVTAVLTAEGVTEKQFLEKAYALEAKSEHPIAKAVTKYAIEEGTPLLDVESFEALSGNGLLGYVEGKKIYGGSKKFISSNIKIDESFIKKADEISMKGMTPILFAEENAFLGMLAIADTIKEDSAKAIAELRDMGIHVVMLTGDNRLAADAIGKIAGVHEVISDVKPDGKEAVIKKLKEYGNVIMVGDGINDAPALTRADIGIAIGAGTDIAIDAADVVLMKSSLRDVVAAIRISRKTLKNIHENLFWAFFYNVIGIPLAAGVWIPIFGWTLNPMFGAAAMSLSSFCVVSNALRLNFVKAYDECHDKKIKKQIGEKILLDSFYEEERKMEISVKGMMCAHCEAHVKKALENIEGVVSAKPDHESGIVSIETSKEVDAKDIKAAIEEAGYEFVG